jgi:hypothetical protein
MSQTDRFSTPIVIGLHLKRRNVVENLSSLLLKGGLYRHSSSSLLLADIYLRGKYPFVLLNLVTLVNMQYTQQ